MPRPKLPRVTFRPTGTSFRVDPKSGRYVEYELNGTITHDERSGNLILSWDGMDGSRKTVTYEPPIRVDAVIAASVDYDAAKKLYRYSYFLSSLARSQQKLQSFFVEAQAPIEDVKSPDASWYSDNLTPFLMATFHVRGGWSWAQTNQGRVGLLPGEKAEGFSFSSSGLPAPVTCFVRPYTEAMRSDEELPEELAEALDPLGWRVPLGVTVGPRLPHNDAELASLVQNILAMVEVSLNEGWIESPEAARDFGGSIAQLLNACKLGNRGRASALLSDILYRVEREKKRALLSEAYALLKFNLQHLRTRLQPDKPKCWGLLPVSQ